MPFQSLSDIPSPVAQVLDGYSEQARTFLLKVRQLILDTAADIEAVGPLTETLKWGEPAYLTEQTGSGSTIRFAWKASRPEVCGLYFNCRTHLVSDFRLLFGGVLTFEGNRAIILNLNEPLPVEPLEGCITAALLYHRKV